MAERMMLVCDTCGRPAVETVTIRSSRGNRQRDYCSEHLDELLGASRAPKRGRRPGSTNASSSKTTKRRTSPARRTAKKTAASRKRANAKR